MAQTLSRRPARTAAGSSAALIDRFFPGPRDFAVRLADGSELPAAGEPVFTLVLKHPGALRRMVTPPIELSMGEAFIYGDFEIEGDIFAAFSLIDASLSRRLSVGDALELARAILAMPRVGRGRRGGRGPARLRGALHSRRRDREAISYHYDVGNEFYALWLDGRMQYSCAYFGEGTEDLNTAQERKLEHICRKLRLRPGERLLDIGCGWGGLGEYAAEKYGVEVLGVTLSRRQAEFAQARPAERATVRLLDYRDLDDGTFDKIVSVGMFEHIGREQLPAYFAKAYRLLKPGGLFLNHGISGRPPQARGGNSARRGRMTAWQKIIKERIVGDGSFAQSYIFPDGQLVPVSLANLIAERAGFEVRDVENLREHYALTLRHWVNRLEARREEAIALTDEVTYRTWRLYMASAAYGFDAARINVNQTLLAKPDGGDAGIPLTRADVYA